MLPLAERCEGDSPSLHPGEALNVSGKYEVDRYELWGDVFVHPSSKLVVSDGNTLAAESIWLEAGSVLEVSGGNLLLTNHSHRRWVGVRGECSQFLITDGSIVEMDGPDGAFDVSSSMGCSVGIDVVCSGSVNIEASQLDLFAGDGLSPHEPMTTGDLAGSAFAGGNAVVRFRSHAPGGSVKMRGSVLNVHAGQGGNAPDGLPPPEDEQNNGGRGGGFTRGGNVTGFVGSGGYVNLTIEAGSVELGAVEVAMVAGRGGDAGDGGSTEYGPQAGTGGGGYSGGDGANGLTREPGAGRGGDVSGFVGAGGEGGVHIDGGSVYLSSFYLELAAGDGGHAGEGGSTEASSGAGGGGYSGGGGGSYFHARGGDGGDVEDRVGSGGDAGISVLAATNLELRGSTLMATGGSGGNAGAGGSSPEDPHGGAGGGGYSGGGGGGEGPVNGDLEGNEGGWGGNVSGGIGAGGAGSVVLGCEDLLLLNSLVTPVGGMGGDGGSAGETAIGPRRGVNQMAGGGGGAFSAGGGGGAGNDRSDGEGGGAAMVTGRIGDGGDATLHILAEVARIHRENNIYAIEGYAGWGFNASAAQRVGGEGRGRQTSNGEKDEFIPMSQTELWHPDRGHRYSYMPPFSWMPLYRSTTNGDVKGYLFQLDDDSSFSEPELSFIVDHPNATVVNASLGKYYWRVRPVYSEPQTTFGPVSETWHFTFANERPTVNCYERISVNERLIRTVYMGLYIEDKDNPLDELVIESDHPAVISIEGMYMSLFYELWEPKHAVPFNVSDGANRVEGHLPVKVIDTNDPPRILSVGDMEPPVVISLMEGTEDWFQVECYEPEGQAISYEVEGTPGIVEIASNGVLHVMAPTGKVGMWGATIFVSDPQGAEASLRIAVEVLNSPDPPSIVEVLSPADGARYREGETVSFAVRVDDPDFEYDEQVTVTWESSLSGQIGSVGTDGLAQISTDQLGVGEHVIHISVTDGIHEDTASLRIRIREGDDSSALLPTSTAFLWGLAVVLTALMLLAGYAVGRRRGLDELEA